MAVALATFAQAGQPGVDIEHVHLPKENFESVFLSTGEQATLLCLPVEQRNIEMTRLWSAKETAFKAHCGLLEMTGFESTSDGQTNFDQLILRNGTKLITVFAQVDAEFVLTYAIASPPAF